MACGPRGRRRWRKHPERNADDHRAHAHRPKRRTLLYRMAYPSGDLRCLGMPEDAFGVGSLTAALAQGLVLGSIVTGLGSDVGSVAFESAAAIGVACGYVVLGSTYLLGKTSGGVALRARKYVTVALLRLRRRGDRGVGGNAGGESGEQASMARS